MVTCREFIRGSSGQRITTLRTNLIHQVWWSSGAFQRPACAIRATCAISAINMETGRNFLGGEGAAQRLNPQRFKDSPSPQPSPWEGEGEEPPPQPSPVGTGEGEEPPPQPSPVGTGEGGRPSPQLSILLIRYCPAIRVLRPRGQRNVSTLHCPLSVLSTFSASVVQSPSLFERSGLGGFAFRSWLREGRICRLTR
jgi:hypothetical protein